MKAVTGSEHGGEELGLRAREGDGLLSAREPSNGATHEDKEGTGDRVRARPIGVSVNGERRIDIRAILERKGGRLRQVRKHPESEKNRMRY